MIDRISFASKTLSAILAGDKPDIDMANPAESWIYNQMVRMRASHFLSEVAKSYVFPSDENVTGKGFLDARVYLENAKGITKHHSYGYALTEQGQRIDELMADTNIKNYKIFGHDYGYRKYDEFALSQSADAKAFILTPGDLFSLQQFVEFKRAVDNGVLPEKEIVVFNDNGFWNDLIGALAVTGDKQIHIVESEAELKAKLQSFGDEMQQPAKNSSSVLRVKPQSIALLQTGNNKKVHELDDILKAQGAIVETLPFSIVVGKPRDPDETSHTTTGNAYEKFEAVQDLLISTSIDNISRSLQRRGVDPENVTVWLDDRAVEFASDYFKTKLFDDCRDKMNEYKPGPNAELANILKVVPIREFYRRLDEATQVLLEENERLGIEGPLEHRSEDIQVYIVAPLKQDDPNRPEYYTFHAMTKNSVHFEPANTEGKHVYSEHFMSLTDVGAPEVRNIELENYFTHHSPMAKAVKAAMGVLGMDKHEQEFKNDPRSQFETAANDSKWKVGLSSHEGRKSLHGVFDDFDLITANDARFSFKGAVQKQKSGLERYLSFMKESDAYVWLPEHDVNPEDHKLFWKNLYLWMSEVVGKQVFNPHIHGKPLVVVDKGDEGACGPLVELFDHMHDMGFLADKPEHIYERFSTLEEAAEYIKESLPKRRRPHVENAPFREEGYENDVLSTVTIYGSATNENPEIYDQTNALSSALALLGFANKNGGGRDGTMRRMSDGAHFARQWSDETGNVLPEHHVASIQCEDTFRSEGVYGESEGQKMNDYTCYCPSIEKRMDILGETNAEIVLPGGAGTIQEIAGSIMKRLYSKDHSDINRPLVIVNQEIHGKRIYDPLVKRMPETMIKGLNIHVVDNWLEALDVVVDARRANGMEPENLPYHQLGEMLHHIEQQHGFTSGKVDIDEAIQWSHRKGAANQNHHSRNTMVYKMG